MPYNLINKVELSTKLIHFLFFQLHHDFNVFPKIILLLLNFIFIASFFFQVIYQMHFHYVPLLYAFLILDYLQSILQNSKNK